jgi:hypothetical protein
LKEIVVDHSFFKELCKVLAAAPEVPDREFVLRRITSKPLTASMRPDFIAPCTHTLLHYLSS